MFIRSHTLKTTLAVCSSVVLLIGFLGVFHFDTGMQADGAMGGCPFMPGESLCMVSPLAHIAAWQSSSAALPFSESTALLLISFFALGICAFSGVFTARVPIPRFSFARARRAREFPASFLQEAFSNGILNTKVF